MSTSGVGDEPTVSERPVDEERRRPLGLAITAVWAAFAIAAPTVIIYRQARDDDGGGAKGKAGGDTVTMAQIKFNPTTLVAARDTVVKFVNEDVAPHTVTEEGGGIDSGVLNPGKTFTLTVNEAFEYICTIHPSMKAKVVLSG
jgi:plastocyanin